MDISDEIVTEKEGDLHRTRFDISFRPFIYALFIIKKSEGIFLPARFPVMQQPVFPGVPDLSRYFHVSLQAGLPENKKAPKTAMSLS